MVSGYYLHICLTWENYKVSCFQGSQIQINTLFVLTE